MDQSLAKEDSSDQKDKECEDDEAKDKDELTIVLIGNSGSGKTTLVNSIANYFSCSTFEKAKSTKVRVYVPTKFSTFIEVGFLPLYSRTDHLRKTVRLSHL